MPESRACKGAGALLDRVPGRERRVLRAMSRHRDDDGGDPGDPHPFEVLPAQTLNPRPFSFSLRLHFREKGRIMTFPIRTGFGLVLAAALLFVTEANSQSSSSQFSDTTVVPLEGVTVTGARTKESLLRTPAAVSVVPRARIASTRQISLADGLQRVPGVFIQNRGGAQDVRITIRGYGARGNGERSNAGNLRGIRILTDGIPITEPDGRSSLELIDLGGIDRIEVLRSNGSALYGNASGGVINLRTSLDFDGPWTEWHARGGSFGFHREQGLLGYTAGRGRGLASVYQSTFDGWREHSQSYTTSIQNRISVPLDDETKLGLLLDFVSNLNRYPGALTAAQLAENPRQANPTFVSRDERRFNRVGRLGVTIDRSPDQAQRFSFATWIEPKVLLRSERNRFRDFNRYHVGGNATWQMDVSLGDAWKSTWTVGADEQFQDGSILFYNLGPGGTRTTTVFQNKREGANSAGGFMQGELRWNDRWGLRVAGRYDNLWYISEDRITPRLNSAKHFTQLTPKASLSRYFGGHTLYGAVGGGVEAPAFNEIDPPAPYDTMTALNPFLDPMRSTSYEVGAKGQLIRDGSLGHLGYEVALYWIDVTNDIIPFNGGAYFFTAGKSRRRGAEFGLDWSPIPAVTLGGAATVSENEYREYVNDLGDFSGHDVAGLPAALLDAELRWRPMTGLSIAGTVRQVGSYFADDANTARVSVYHVLGAEATWVHRTPFGQIRAFVNGENLTDEDYVASVFINGINGQFYEPGLPASVTAGVGIAFR
jgi:iron complex outermembrane recepter protein